MFRWVCLFVVLPLCVLGQAGVLLSTPSKSPMLATDLPKFDETSAHTVPPTTRHSEIVTTTSSDVKVTTLQAKSTVEPTTPPSQSTTSLTPSTDSTSAPSTTQPTNTTLAPPTTQPTNTTTTTTVAPTTPPVPKVGDYFVRAEWNSSACLMARMGLQFSLKMGDSFQTLNLDPNPNVTISSGTCGNNGSDAALLLISDKIALQLIFTNETSKFFLSGLNVTVRDGSGAVFAAINTNLSLWEASLGSSYMCKKEQSFNITETLILNTFDLQVQPFGVVNEKFSTAHECSVDDTSLLIPIIVGAALAVLILIVVIAYVIGRRKTYVGYQTL